MSYNLFISRVILETQCESCTMHVCKVFWIWLRKQSDLRVYMAEIVLLNRILKIQNIFDWLCNGYVLYIYIYIYTLVMLFKEQGAKAHHFKADIVTLELGNSGQMFSHSKHDSHFLNTYSHTHTPEIVFSFKACLRKQACLHVYPLCPLFPWQQHDKPARVTGSGNTWNHFETMCQRKEGQTEKLI